MTKFNYGVRTVTSDNRRSWGFVQTGFIKAEAEAEAARLNDLGTLPGVTYEAAEVTK